MKLVSSVVVLVALSAVAGCESSSNAGGGGGGGGGTYVGGSPTCATLGCSNGQVCVNAACQNCTAHAQCDSQSICYSGHCILAAGRKYTITFTSGTIPTQTPKGDAWDGLGGAPDPFVELKNGGVSVCKTSAKQDTFTPQWNEACDIDVLASDQFDITAWDEDSLNNDKIDGSTITNMVPFIRAGGISGPMYAGSTSSLSWTITAK